MSRAPKRILVVDDSDLIRRTIQRTVATPEDTIETASNGVDALKAVECFDAEVVTMDISMPLMDGLTCLEGLLRIRPNARVLVISGFKDKPTAVEAVRRGAQGFLLKPFSSEALKLEISELLN